MEFIKDIFQYFVERKKWWLMPIILIFLILGTLLLLAPGGVVAPFSYSLFEGHEDKKIATRYCHHMPPHHNDLPVFYMDKTQPWHPSQSIHSHRFSYLYIKRFL